MVASVKRMLTVFIQRSNPRPATSIRTEGRRLAADGPPSETLG
jgi:hypothetical protein